MPSRVGAHLVAVPASWAQDLSLFCAHNPQACPVRDICATGTWTTRLADDADLRTALPRYRVWEDGVVVAEPAGATAHWRTDLVAFLLGAPCSLDEALAAAGVPLRHVEQGLPLPAYATNRSTRPAGRLSGPLVATMRPVPAALTATVRTVCREANGLRGGPLHIGDPSSLGVRALARPDFGEPVRPLPGDVPVFWPSPHTVEAALASSRPPYAVTGG
ncbi:D-glutamate cyclase family protein [Streptomyces sp. NPDC048172]|uniref:D-glutamate cyclase family protein n=1 Tax=Streptomyces sp. NPDC048172 TaxID=3365505 RepID=UPI003720550C